MRLAFNAREYIRSSSCEARESPLLSGHLLTLSENTSYSLLRAYPLAVEVGREKAAPNLRIALFKFYGQPRVRGSPVLSGA